MIRALNGIISETPTALTDRIRVSVPNLTIATRQVYGPLPFDPIVSGQGGTRLPTRGDKAVVGVDEATGDNWLLAWHRDDTAEPPYSEEGGGDGPVEVEEWHSDAGAPSGAIGSIGDWYLNQTNGDVYEKTGVSSWTLRLNIKGPQGDPGETGPEGPEGPEGPAGEVTTSELNTAIATRMEAPEEAGSFYDFPSRALNTPYTPHATRPTLVIATLYIFCTTGEEGRVDIQTGSGSLTTICDVFLRNGNTSVVNVHTPVTFIVPPNWDYQLTTVNVAGTPDFSLVEVVEATL